MTVLTVGETMALLDPVADDPLENGSTMRIRCAGAESNFAIALARLGVGVTWVSRLGDDPLGDMIETTLRSEGVDLRWVRREPGTTTGLYMKWRTEARTRVLYFRSASAARSLEADDVPPAALEGVSLVHVTGITMALSDSARALVVDLARRARDQGAIVLFDPNLRPAQWESPAAAAETHREVLPYTDWYLCGEQEGCQLFGAPNAVGVLEAARAGGARAAIVRVGTRGAVIDGDDGPLEIPPVELAQVVDEVGAGDAFAAGFAYGLLEGWSVPESARSANILAAAALAGTGDWETLPYLAELERRLRAAGGLPQG